MRVMYLLNTFHSGGAERDVVMVCQHANRNRIIPEVGVLHGKGRYLADIEAAGVRLLDFGRQHAYDPMFAYKCARKIANLDVDLIHVFLPAPAFYVALAKAAFGLRIPVVYSELTSQAIHWHRRILQSWFLHNYCDGYVANSEASAQCLCKYGIPRPRIHIIPNGHNASVVQNTSDRQRIRESFGVQHYDLALIYVGRLIKTKRVDDLIETARIVRESNIRFKLLLVGEGPERQELMRMISRYGLHALVILLGERTDVQELLSASDVFVFASEVEGLPNAIIEAALAKLPIVCANIPAIASLVIHGDSALVVPPRDPRSMAHAVQQLSNDQTLRARLGSRAYEGAVRNFSIHATLDALYEFYTKLV